MPLLRDLYQMEDETLKNICKELGIPWTDDVKDIERMVDNKLDEALAKEQMEKDL
jgi:hypothetical protein